ncbi:MAG: SdrD B-like domain-containing protein [bacterium]|nr:T9SS type A sorting domain-containing protein [candidate division KSB1 bacterium]MDH7558853.1 SdrD B-like domain-containing protein [bacterium]
MMRRTISKGTVLLCAVLLTGVTACLGLLVRSDKAGAKELDGDDYMQVTLPPITGHVDMVAGGVGLVTGSGTFQLVVPEGVTIEAAYLYWGGQDSNSPPNHWGDPEVELQIDGGASTTITGQLIGMTTAIAGRFRFSYRADVTAKITPGTHMVSLSGFDPGLLGSSGRAFGGGILVVYSKPDLPLATISIADGVDYFLFSKFHPTSQILRFGFSAAPVARTTELLLMVGGVEEDEATGLWYQVGSDAIPAGSIVDAPGAVDYDHSSSPVNGEDTDPFHSANGQEWDILTMSVQLPAESAWLAVQIESQSDSPYGKRSASGIWVVCAMRLPLVGMGSIGDFVWNDADGDGVQDEGEQGIDGVTVILREGSEGETERITWTVTGDNPATEEVEHGWYRFTGLTAGHYLVDVDDTTLPVNFAGLPPILTTAGDPLVVDLAEGQDYDDADFGYMENPVPVELTSFSAVWHNEEVHLRWSTASETENMGFDVYRAEGEDGPFVKINKALIPGAGNASVLHTYTYVDRDVELGKGYYYKLADVDYRGRIRLHGPISVASGPVPMVYELQQNYPNPFNPETTIRFHVKSEGRVWIGIYNAAGQLVRHLADEIMSAGSHSLVWNGKNDAGEPLSSGTYFCVMRVNGVELSKKVLLTR